MSDKNDKNDTQKKGLMSSLIGMAAAGAASGLHRPPYGGYPHPAGGYPYPPSGYPPPGGYPPTGYLYPPPSGYPPPGYPSSSGFPPPGYPSVGGYPLSVGYPPVGYPGPSPAHGQARAGMGLLAGGVATAAAVYGAHHLAHGSHHHGKFKHGKFKHGKHGFLRKHKFMKFK